MDVANPPGSKQRQKEKDHSTVRRISSSPNYQARGNWSGNWSPCSSDSYASPSPSPTPGNPRKKYGSLSARVPSVQPPVRKHKKFPSDQNISKRSATVPASMSRSLDDLCKLDK